MASVSLLLPQVEKDSAANELTLENVGGVFLVLSAGLLIACFMACLERCFYQKVNKRVKMVRTHVARAVLTHSSASLVRKKTERVRLGTGTYRGGSARWSWSRCRTYERHVRDTFASQHCVFHSHMCLYTDGRTRTYGAHHIQKLAHFLIRVSA